MAVSPLQQVEYTEDTLPDALEAEIDAFLSKNPHKRAFGVWLDHTHSVPQDTHTMNRALRATERRYVKAGWQSMHLRYMAPRFHNDEHYFDVILYGPSRQK